MSIKSEVAEMFTKLCEDCDGKGYNEYGGMAMEDDLIEKVPCDNQLHDPKTATQILQLLKDKLPKENMTIYGGVRRPGWEVALAKDNGYKDGWNNAIREVHKLLGDGK